MTKKILFLLFFTFHVSRFTSLNAGFLDVSPGKTGVSFLRVPLSARVVALGNCGAGASGADFIERNPASFYGCETAMQFSHLNYFEGLSLNQAGIFLNFRDGYDTFSGNKLEHFICLEIKNFSSSDDRRDMLTGEKTGSFGINNRCLRLAYAFEKKDVRYGIAGKSVTEKIDESSSDGFAFDFGMIRWLGETASFGLSVQNIGRDISSSPLPLTVSAGFSIEGLRDCLLLDIEKTEEEESKMSCGIEHSLDFMELRAGISRQDILRPSAGFGIKRGHFAIDYAFSFHRYLGGNHLFTVSARF
ncbi:MAG: hypothetical protein ABIJ15_05225 [bacterium]